MKISNEVLQILDQCRTDGGLLYLPEQLDRKSYEAVNKILVAAGGKWNRGKKAHVFEGYAAEAIEGVMLTGEIADAKRDFGFFPTPAGVVDILLDRAEIEPHHTALEPQAGRGAIAFPLSLACAAVDVVELLAENFITLDGPFRRAAWKDFLTIDPDEWGERYDRIVMNPPFGGQADIDHVVHASWFLKPGGRLVSVMAAGVNFRENRKTLNFRSMVDSCQGWIEPLPEGSFASSGTNVNTVIVTINKGE